MSLGGALNLWCLHSLILPNGRARPAQTTNLSYVFELQKSEQTEMKQDISKVTSKIQSFVFPYLGTVWSI